MQQVRRQWILCHASIGMVAARQHSEITVAVVSNPGEAATLADGWGIR